MSTVFVSGDAGLGTNPPVTGFHGRIRGNSDDVGRCGDATITCGQIEFPTTSGDIFLGDLSINTSIELATSAFAGNISMGTSSSTTDFPGDVTVTGTTFTIGSSTVDIADNLIVIKSGGGTAASDGGSLSERNNTDWQADPTPLQIDMHAQAAISTGTTELPRTQTKLSGSASSIDGFYVDATIRRKYGDFGTFPTLEQTRSIDAYDGTTKIATHAAWTDITITGTTVNATATFAAFTYTSPAIFDANFQIGDVIYNPTGPSRQVIDTMGGGSGTVVGVWSNGMGNTATWSGHGGSDSILSPTATTPLELIATKHVGIIWDESADVFAATATMLEPGDSVVEITTYAPFQPRYNQFLETTTGDLPSTISDTGIIYTKDVSALTELFYRDDAGTQTQLTANGVLAASPTLQAAYDADENIVYTSVQQSITLDANNADTLVDSILELNPGVLGNTSAALDITWQAGEYTSNVHGITIDFSSVSSLTGADAIGIHLKGDGSLGVDEMAIRIDDNFGVANGSPIAIGDSAYTSLTNEGSNDSTWNFSTRTGAVTIDGMDLKVAPGSGGDGSGGVAGDGGDIILKAAQAGAAATGFAAGAGGDIDLDAGDGGAGSSAFAGSTGGAFSISSGAGAASVTGFAGVAGGALSVISGPGGTSNESGSDGGVGGVMDIYGGDGGDSTNTGNGGTGGAVTLKAGDGGDTSGGTSGDGGILTLQAGDGSGAATSGVIRVRSGNGGASSGDAGDIFVDVGASASGTPGNILLGSVNKPPQIQINTGSAGGGTPGLDVNSLGAIDIASDTNATVGQDSSVVTFKTGDNNTSGGASASDTGAIAISTGDTAETADTNSDTGDITISTGDTASGGSSDSGSISFETGRAGLGASLAGKIQLSPGTAAARGDVRVGTSSDICQNHVVIHGGNAADLAGELVMQNNAGNFFSLWVDANGDLRVEDIGASLPGDGAQGKTGDTNVASTIVGEQGS